MSRHQADFGRLPPDKRLTSDKVPELLTRLDRTLDRLATWGIRVPASGRLRDARSELQAISKHRTYELNETGLRRAAEALSLARDFTQVVDALGDEVAEDLIHQLSKSMGGTLTAEERNRAPYQFQTQFVFGAALIQGGLRPRAPSLDARGPDYIVCPGTVRFGVEIKRPSSRRGVFDQLTSARDQLNSSGLHGVVVLDLTDCLDELGLKRFDRSPTVFPTPDLKEPYRALADKVSDVIWNWSAREYRPGFERVMGVWYLLRGWRWLLDDLTAPHLFEFQGFHRYSSSRGNIWHHRADELHKLALTGMMANGLFINQAEQESPQHIDVPWWDDANWPGGAS